MECVILKNIYIYDQYEIILRKHYTQSLRIHKQNFGNFWKFKVPHKFLLRRGEGGERKRETPPCSCTIMFRFLSLHEYDSTSRCSTVPGSWASFRFHGKLKMAILGSYFETLHGKQLCFTRAYEKIMRQLLARLSIFTQVIYLFIMRKGVSAREGFVTSPLWTLEHWCLEFAFLL